jgi:cation diffusion facilitator CzcD-associated flavoprotein CzcO
VAIIGSGFAGLGMAVPLRRRGERDVVVLERGDRRRWRPAGQHLPRRGLRRAVPPLLVLLAPDPDRPRTYSAQPEIQAHLRDTADRFGVRAHCVFGVEVTAARGDDTATWPDSTFRFGAPTRRPDRESYVGTPPGRAA